VPTPNLRVFDSLAELSPAAHEQLADLGTHAVAERGRFTLALSGGGTPLVLYRLMAQTPQAMGGRWAQTHVFWGDERCVPPDDPGSSFGQARDVLLKHVPLPEENIHRVFGEWEPQKAAEDYARQLRQFAEAGLAWPRFDVVLLGMGDDGHTASLFPGPITKAERTRPTMAVTASYQDRPANRVTLTPLVFNSARNIVFLVAGESKAEALAAVLSGSADPERWPAARIRPTDGTVTWFVDRAAAKLLDR
jgi:6-phosphogluconolactonase